MSKSFVTLKTDKTHRAKKSIILAGITVEFDKYCMADVPQRYVKDLVNAGLIIVDEKELREFEAKRKEEPVKEVEVPLVDIADENAKLKKENAKLKSENEELKNLLAEMEAEKLQNSEDKENEEDIENIELGQMKFKEMQELCVQTHLPEDEWKKIKKTDELREYLGTKMNA